MTDPNLSYVLTTRNRLPHLQVTLRRLLDHLQPDEEIVVVDGGSTDGTAGYLAELHKTGELSSFLSRADHGEAHGFNRGVLLAKGHLIKVVSDDDAYHWRGIEACKQFMIEHADVDVIGSNGGGTNWALSDPYVPMVYDEAFLRWKLERRSFSFCGLGLMIRRDSLPLLGLFNPAFVRVDMEYTLRITQGPARLAWYQGLNYIRVLHEQSSAEVRSAALVDEAAYEEAHQGVVGVRPQTVDGPATSRPGRFLSMADHLRGRIRSMTSASDERAVGAERISQGPVDWLTRFEGAEKHLAEWNRDPHGFLY